MVDFFSPVSPFAEGAKVEPAFGDSASAGLFPADHPLRRQVRSRAVPRLVDLAEWTRCLERALALTARHHETFALHAIRLGSKRLGMSADAEASDEITRYVGQELHRLLRVSDVATFADRQHLLVLQCAIRHPRGAERLAELLLSTTERALIAAGVTVPAHVAVATLTSLPGDHAESLLELCSDLLASVPRTGCIVRHRRPPATGRELVRTALRTALRSDSLRLVFQPFVDLRTGQFRGAEALVRLEAPGLGAIDTGTLIDEAEGAGLADQLTSTVLGKATLFWRDLLKNFPENTEIPRLAVNMGATQLQNPHFVQLLTSILKQSSLPPQALEVEVTESRAGLFDSRSLSHLQELRGLGIAIALDDFGEGANTLDRLIEIPCDRIKISASMIKRLVDDPTSPRHDPNDESSERRHRVLAWTLELAGDLELRTTAEGVETAGQLQWLREHGCRDGQGFWFAPPLTEADLRARVRRAVTRLQRA